MGEQPQKPEKPKSPELYELLRNLGRYRLTLEGFQKEFQRMREFIIAVEEFPENDPRRREMHNQFSAALDQWRDTIRITLEDHIEPLIQQIDELKKKESNS